MKQMHQCIITFTIATSPAEISATNLDNTNHKSLFYFDCFGLKERELELLLDSIYQILQPRHLRALFNLDEESGIENKALNYGVRGFFYPGDSPADLCKGTQTILDGEIWLSRQLASNVILSGVQTPPRISCTKADEALLSAREKEVLGYLTSGASGKEIAAELFISVHTLRTHLYRIYRKIKVHNRVQAIYWAEKNL